MTTDLDPYPLSDIQLQARIIKNSYADGDGLSTRQVMACPFCGAKDFMPISITNAQVDMQVECTCPECARVGKNIVQQIAGNGLHFQLVQTGGPDPEKWQTVPPVDLRKGHDGNGNGGKI